MKEHKDARAPNLVLSLKHVFRFLVFVSRIQIASQAFNCKEDFPGSPDRFPDFHDRSSLLICFPQARSAGFPTRNERSPAGNGRSAARNDRCAARNDRSAARNDGAPSRNDRSPAGNDGSPGRNDGSPARNDGSRSRNDRSPSAQSNVCNGVSGVRIGYEPISYQCLHIPLRLSLCLLCGPLLLCVEYYRVPASFRWKRAGDQSAAPGSHNPCVR